MPFGVGFCALKYKSMILKYTKKGWVREDFQHLHEPTFDPIIICHDVMEHEPKIYEVDSINDEFTAVGRSLYLRGMAYERRTGGSYDKWVGALAHDIHYILSFDIPFYRSKYEVPKSFPLMAMLDSSIRLARSRKPISQDVAEEIKRCLVSGYYHAIEKYGDNEESATKMVLDMADYLQKCPMKDLEMDYDGEVWRVRTIR